MNITLNPLRRKKGVTLLEFILLSALLMMIAAGIICISIEAFRALQRLLNQRNEDIRRIVDDDENGDGKPVSFYQRTQEGWAV